MPCGSQALPVPTTPSTHSAGEPMSQLLRVEGISKEFPGVKALDGVNFELDRGEVLALVGENGAGKSTLMKILSGIYTPDAGRIVIEDDEVDVTGPKAAQRLGISII